MDLSEKYIQSSYFLLKHLEPESEDDVIDTRDGKKFHRMGLFDDKGNQVDDYDCFRMGDGVCLDYMVDKDGNEGFRLFGRWGRWSKLVYNPVWHEVFAMKPTPIYSAKYQKKEEKK